jgi:hypothetical protein
MGDFSSDVCGITGEMREFLDLLGMTPLIVEAERFSG